jgi:hypothetical protein
MRILVRTLLALVVVLVAAWVGLWWYAQQRMQTGITAWADRMVSQGNVKVAYDTLTRGTSPLAARVNLTNLLITVQPDPNVAPVSIALPSVALEIDAADPLLLRTDLPNQVNISTSRGDFAITFGRISQTQKLDLHALLASEIEPFNTGDINASNINVLASSGSLLVLHIDNYTGHGAYDRKAGAGQTAFNFVETLKGISLSPLLTRLASIPFGGRITQVGLTMNASGPVPGNLQALMAQYDAVPVDDKAGREKIVFQALHDWAAQGGKADGQLNLAVGPSTLNAGGDVGFDAKTQPQGKADITADHLDAFSAAITNAYPDAQSVINEAQARLSPYLSSTDTGGQTLTMHVVYGSGAVNINGQKTSDMPPLNWDLLENPPAQAPGDGSGAATP